jgi:hypothetical protein
MAGDWREFKAEATEKISEPGVRVPAWLLSRVEETESQNRAK